MTRELERNSGLVGLAGAKQDCANGVRPSPGCRTDAMPRFSADDLSTLIKQLDLDVAVESASRPRIVSE